MKNSHLQKYHDGRKRMTVKRVAAAIESLKKRDLPVSLNAIADETNRLFGKKIAVTTVQNNAETRAMFEQHSIFIKKRERRAPKVAIASDASEMERQQFQRRIRSLSHAPKKKLVSLLLSAERKVQQLEKETENLRDALLLKYSKQETPLTAETHESDHP